MPHPRHIVLTLLCSVLAIVATPTSANPDLQAFELQTSYESWRLPAHENMGMARLGLRQQFGEYWNGGVDAYTAVQGQRGGFITLGLAGGFEYPLTSQLALESGLFIGAGGGRGGYELTGGGLMLRENIGLKYYLPAYGSISVGMSRVDFPNGGVIKSQQLYVGYNLAFNALTEASTLRPGRRYFNDLSESYQATTHQFSIKARQLRIPSGVLNDAHQPQDNFGLLGAEWRTFVTKHWFLKLDSAGAMHGNSRGYMHILAGGGYQYPLSKNLSIYSSLTLGGGGGGAVNTGGGLLWDAALGAQYFFSKNWYADVSVSKLWAGSTPFESKGIGLQIGYQFGPSASSDRGFNASVFDSHPLRIRTVYQEYTKANEHWRNRPNQNVGNLGAQADYFLSPNWYLTGQGLGAHSGDAGAYMTGLVGTGVRSKITTNTFIELEGLVGAAGGGGLNTGSGLIYQANVGLGYQLSKSLEIQGNLGEIKAANGDFRAHVLGLSLAYKFNLLTAR